MQLIALYIYNTQHRANNSLILYCTYIYNLFVTLLNSRISSWHSNILCTKFCNRKTYAYRTYYSAVRQADDLLTSITVYYVHTHHLLCSAACDCKTFPTGCIISMLITLLNRSRSIIYAPHVYACMYSVQHAVTMLNNILFIKNGWTAFLDTYERKALLAVAVRNIIKFNYG